MLILCVGAMYFDIRGVRLQFLKKNHVVRLFLGVRLLGSLDHLHIKELKKSTPHAY